MTFATSLILVMPFGLSVLAQTGAVPACLQGYATKLRSVLGKKEAEEFFHVIGAFGPDAQRGTRAFLEFADDAEDLYKTVFETLEQTFPPGSKANPFASDEAFFEAIGEMVQEGRPLVVPQGLGITLRQVSDFAVDGEGFKKAQGAIFDLYIAKRAGSGASLQFQVSRTVGDPSIASDLQRTRIPDLVQALPECPAACGDLPGIINENKNWTAPINDAVADSPLPGAANGGFRYADVRLTSLADEFARDIVMVKGSGFRLYRLNFNREMLIHAETIRSVLRKQFESPFVTRQMTPAEIETLLTDFEQRLGEFLVFVP